MPRVKWNVMCTARKTKGGAPCDAWAILGGTICAVHGGRQARTREAARLRLAKQICHRAFGIAYTKWRQRVFDFHVNRLATAAYLLDKPVDQIDEWDLVFCHADHGVPPLAREAPTIRDVPLDRRILKAIDTIERERRRPRSPQRICDRKSRTSRRGSWRCTASARRCRIRSRPLATAWSN
jgi:hypothetical protein